MTTVQDLISKLIQTNVQECPFIKGIVGMQCEDIDTLEIGEIIGDVDPGLAAQYHERCLAFGWPECNLFRQYVREIRKDAEGVKIERVSPLNLCYLNSKVTIGK